MRANSSTDFSRNLPLGRSALWLCVGYGLGAVIGWAVHVLFNVGHPQYSSALTLMWPLLIGLMGGVLLVIGTMPASRIAISVSTANALEQEGTPGLARIRYLNSTTNGSFKTLTVSLDVASSSSRVYRSELVWKLSAVDALKLRPGATIPVRIDPQAPSRVVFDTRATSNDLGPDPNEVFSVRNRFRRRLSRIRPASCIATLVGFVIGLGIGLFT